MVTKQRMRLILDKICYKKDGLYRCKVCNGYMCTIDGIWHKNNIFGSDYSLLIERITGIERIGSGDDHNYNHPLEYSVLYKGKVPKEIR